jgi:hypothetical protein
VDEEDEEGEDEESDEDHAVPAVDCCNRMEVAMYSGV